VNERTIAAIVDEIAPVLAGATLGKIFQISRLSLALDFRTRDGRYLLINAEPQTGPRLYLIERKVRELEKNPSQQGSFVQTMFKRVAGAQLVSIKKDDGDRVVRFELKTSNIAGEPERYSLVAQLTGRSANVILLDETDRIIDSLRPQRGEGGEGREVGDVYKPPAGAIAAATTELAIDQGEFPSLSAAADHFYSSLEADRAFDARAASARSQLKREIAQRTKLRSHLENDLANHGNPDEHKRIGDLLIANIATAERNGSTTTVTDYYSEGMPRIDIEIDENATLPEEAARRFAGYTKARRAAEAIAQRLITLEDELVGLQARQGELEEIVSQRNAGGLERFLEDKTKSRPARTKQKTADTVPGARRYKSSDGYEILVGRASRDNDNLTFRIAKPHDLWLHAADYPGSHVVVLNPTRKEIPHRTIIEAAQLAASFSQARRDSKVDVHYTQRKFLSKPKGSAPGLVRMSSFRSLTVEPSQEFERL
jgi:predicted ribosome quality control (RQC) complex YloA/Tae2 family protein